MMMVFDIETDIERYQKTNFYDSRNFIYKAFAYFFTNEAKNAELEFRKIILIFIQELLLR